MTKRRSKFVLAFYPNQVGFGFALMENALTLKDYQMVSSRPWGMDVLLKRMREYIDYYEPEIVVLEDYNGKQSRKGKRVQKFIDSIRDYAQKKDIQVYQYSREQIRLVFSNFQAKSKHEISTVIAENIPILKEKLRPKRKIFESEAYSGGIFSAVSLAITHYYLTD